MSDYSHSSELVLSELLRISTGFIWKNPKRALDNENQSYSIDVEQYKLSVQNKLTFDIVYKFYPEAIMELGYTEEQANLYSDMPARIPILCAPSENRLLLSFHIPDSFSEDISSS